MKQQCKKLWIVSELDVTRVFGLVFGFFESVCFVLVLVFSKGGTNRRLKTKAL